MADAEDIDRGSGAAPAPEPDKDESALTVVVAIVANLAVAIAKGVAGALSGSAAMLSESAHSLADTTNECLLLVAVKRSARPADARHQFGYGRERYFWTLLAAVGIFVGGGVFAVQEGIRQLLGSGAEGGHYLLSYGVLGLAFVFEGVSWTRAVRQLREDGRRTHRSFRAQVWDTTDPTATTVFFEDSAALVGLLLAALGIGLHQATGNPYADSAASIAIGLLLTAVAFLLGRENRSLIVGESADPRLQRAVTELLSSYPEVTRVEELLTMVIGRGEILVAARLDLEDELRAGEIEELARRMEHDVIERNPMVRHFFVDITADTINSTR
ncbi:MAG TPA: cation diffusion facilitator family transporter [Mycobacteriales bacterium]|nr:cation diffusion facilitator family transporter [Mycobacteriales bacterium]